jgi:hypothetical protein
VWRGEPEEEGRPRFFCKQTSKKPNILSINPSSLLPNKKKVQNTNKDSSSIVQTRRAAGREK